MEENAHINTLKSFLPWKDLFIPDVLSNFRKARLYESEIKIYSLCNIDPTFC